MTRFHARSARDRPKVIWASIVREARALRNQKDLSGRAVIDVLCHLGGYLTGQIRAKARDQRGRAGIGMLGAGAPALRIGRPRSPGSGGPSCGADLGRAV
jgi:hypothetical protein